jgi:hypothetical protein
LQAAKGIIMSILSRRTKAILATVAVAAGLFVATPVATASAEPSGTYVWVCVGTDGNSYTLKKGVKITTCHGSYLQQYIGGHFIKAFPLTLSGKIGKSKPLTADCIIAVGTTAVGILTSADGISWVVTVVGLYGLHSCVA